MILKRLFYKLYNLYAVNFTRKKYTNNELKLLNEFEYELKQIKPVLNVSDFWINALEELRQFIKLNSLLNILQSPTIKYTMIAEPEKIELDKILKSDKSAVFKKIINEDWIGKPTPYFYYLKSSGNTIHHAYSLLQLYNTFDVDIRKLTTIFEFGGGYGNFCKLLIKSNFNGNYVIFDLPLMSSIQKLYLKLCDVKFNIVLSTNSDNKTISLINETSQITKNNPDLFIALWSLSECPLSLRDQILENNSAASYFLIAYSNEFMGTDNHKYFENFRNKMTSHIWVSYEIQHMKGHTYLIGKKID